MHISADASCASPSGDQSTCGRGVVEGGGKSLRIAFVLSTLRAGGAQKVATVLSRHWAALGHEVELITFEGPDATPHFGLPPGVKLTAIGVASGTGNLLGRSLQRTLRLRSALQRMRPDIGVAFMAETNAIAIAAARTCGLPVVVSERVHPAHSAVGHIRDILRRIAYPMSDALVVQTTDIAEYCRAAFRTPTVVLANPVERAKVTVPPARGKAAGRRILAAGRLTPQKGYDVLIRAFAAIADKHPAWRLTIVGDGEERGALQALIEQHGLGARVDMPGTVADIEPALGACDLFVHPARHEGFPNALTEALATGCAVVATDCPGASRELLQDGRYGALVPVDDVVAVAREMSRLMGDDELRAAMGARAHEAVAAYDAKGIAASWLVLFRRIIAARSGSV